MVKHAGHTSFYTAKGNSLVHWKRKPAKRRTVATDYFNVTLIVEMLTNMHVDYKSCIALIERSPRLCRDSY